MPSWKKVIVSGSDAFLNALTVTNGITGSLHGTASWAQNAITASYALNAVSASHAITASYALNSDLLDGKDSSVFATTGSNIFVGNQTVTGSLFTTGSNTLIGTTSLTGSLNISGSETITGYIQFEPVTTNINPAISASYIYVSGSTSDLYFSQNGEGYSNTTRLRWLEGNLYTGLLNGGLITTQSSTVYQISSGSGIIVDLNASLNDDPYPVIQYLNWPNLSASIAPFTASFQQAFVGIDSTNNIFAQGTPFSNGQFDNIINIGNVLFQNQSTINGVKTQPSVAYGFEQQQNTFNRAFGPLKLSGYTLAPSGSSTGSLIVASGTAYAPGSNYTIDPNESYYTVDSGTNVSKIFRYHQSGSTWVYNTNAGAGFATIDPTQYSNNGVLTAVPGGGSNRQWSIQRVFYFPNSVTKAIVVYYGNATYTTEVDAIANISFESFVEAPNTAANAIYLGAIIVRNDADFTNSATYKIQPGGLFRQVGGSGGGGSIITQTLAGLSDVNISGPTDGQALVYNTTQAKWINSSAISASITGNAATATSASFATTASYVLNAVSASFATSASQAQNSTTASYVLNAVSASYTTNALSSSYAITASHALNANTASYVLNAVSASFATSASQAQNATTASYVLNAVSASFAISASQAQNATTASYVLNAVSASFAATASSVTGTVTSASYAVTASILRNDTAKVSASSATYTSGSSLLYNLSEFKGAMVDYVVSTSGSGNSTRAGTFTAVWNSVFSSYNESTTMDIGNTDAVSFSANSTGSIFINVTSGSWEVDSLYRALGNATITTPPPTTTVTVKFYSTGTSAPLVGLTCASTSSYSVQIFGDPGNNSPTFCGTDELLAIDLTNILAGGHSIPVGSTFYLSSGGQVRTWIRPFDSNLAYWHLDSCQACPTTTTTTTSTTTTTTTIAPNLFTHGTVIATCSDYCNSNYTIATATVADNNYASLTIGDTIYGQGGVAGYVAYSNASTDTTTGPFKVAQIGSSGVIIGITECSGGSCVPV
jgi:hypothetical protein